MIEVIMNLDLYSDLQKYQELIDRLTTEDKIIIYLINYTSDKIKTNSFLQRLYDAQAIVKPLERQIVKLLEVTDDKIAEAKNIMPDIPIQSALELLYASDLNINVVITENPELYEYELSNLNDFITLTVSIEGIEYFSSLINAEENKCSLLNESQIQSAIEFISKHGVRDWIDWYLDHHKLNAELNLIEEVLCTLEERQEYIKLKNTWDSLNRFYDFEGYHSERIKWLNKLIKLAAEHDDREYFLISHVRLAWTYIMEARLEKAEELLSVVKRELNKITQSSYLLSFYHCLFTYHIYSYLNKQKSSIKKEYSTSHLEGAEKAVISQQLKLIDSYNCSTTNILTTQKYFDFTIKNTRTYKNNECEYSTFHKIYEDTGNNGTVHSLYLYDLGEKERDRYQVNILRNVARIHHIKGNLLLALDIYQLALYISTEINYDRGRCYMYNKLANIYLEFAESQGSYRGQNLEMARYYLDIGKPIAEENNHSRRLCSYNKSESRFSFLEGNTEKSKDQKSNAMEYAFLYQKTDLK
jgi:hypothetical protein